MEWFLGEGILVQYVHCYLKLSIVDDCKSTQNFLLQTV